MDSVSEAQFELDQLRLQAKRQLMGTVLLGVMAGLLAFVGQSALGQARPLLEGSFGSWQSFYTFVLWALAIAWLVALAQQAIHFQNISERFESQRRLDAVYAERAAKAQAAEEVRQRQRAESEARQAAERIKRQNSICKEIISLSISTVKIRSGRSRAGKDHSPGFIQTKPSPCIRSTGICVCFRIFPAFKSLLSRVWNCMKYPALFACVYIKSADMSRGGQR